MKIKGLSGESGYKGLKPATEVIQQDSSGQTISVVTSLEWKLSENYYFSKQDAQNCLGIQCKWPVRVHADGSVYVVSTEEFNELHEDSTSI